MIQTAAHWINLNSLVCKWNVSYWLTFLAYTMVSVSSKTLTDLLQTNLT